MPKASFLRLNSEREAANEELFANPRNAAAGSVRQLDSAVCASRGLDAFWYYFVNAVDYGIMSHEDALEEMERMHLKVNPLRRVCDRVEEIWAFIEEITQQRHSLPYEIDGMVIKVDDLAGADPPGHDGQGAAMGDGVQISGGRGADAPARHRAERRTHRAHHAQRRA